MRTIVVCGVISLIWGKDCLQHALPYHRGFANKMPMLLVLRKATFNFGCSPLLGVVEFLEQIVLKIKYQGKVYG